MACPGFVQWNGMESPIASSYYGLSAWVKEESTETA